MRVNIPEHPNVQVRLCGPDDLPKIQAVLQLSPEAAPWGLSSFQEICKAHLKYFLIAVWNREVRGFISGRRLLDEAEILNLAVHPEARRLGIGRALLQALLEAYARENVLKVFLEVRESNRAAIEFYSKSGFQPTGRRSNYYRNPDEAALLLTLSVQSTPSGYIVPT